MELMHIFSIMYVTQMDYFSMNYMYMSDHNMLTPPPPQVGSTPLHVASLRHHPETIKVLRFYHADVYAENKVNYYDE